MDCTLECNIDMESRKQNNIEQEELLRELPALPERYQLCIIIIIIIFKAKDAERKKFCEDLEGEDGKGMCSG